MGFFDGGFAGILGAAGSAIGSLWTNKQQKAQASKQMDYQTYMSNSAYQRAARDLEKAGLNRILAIGSPASTPAGAQAQLQDMGKAITGGLTAGMNSAIAVQQLKQQKVQTRFDQRADKYYKNLPDKVKEVIDAANMAKKVGIRPEVVAGAQAAAKAAQEAATAAKKAAGSFFDKSKNKDTVEMLKESANKRKEAFNKTTDTGRSKRQEWKDDDWIYNPWKKGERPIRW
jgi:hypothetical protein